MIAFPADVHPPLCRIPLPADLYPPLCHEQVIVKIIPNISAPGAKLSSGVQVILRNTSKEPCQVFATPSIDLHPEGERSAAEKIVDTSTCLNILLGKNRTRTCALPPVGGIAPRIIIPPEGAVSSSIEWNQKELTGPRCVDVDRVRVNGFNNGSLGHFPIKARLCGKLTGWVTFTPHLYQSYE